MRMIHCADLHLDLKMSSNLDKESAKERKGELLHTFERMVSYAVRNEVTAILIAGDLFDTKNISATARNIVLHNIKNHPEIRFYYLKGNHDSDNFFAGLQEIPDNLKLFGKEWISYEEAGGRIIISGLELTPENSGSAGISLVLDSDKFNIVMLHGQEAESEGKEKAEIIHLKQFRNKGIDYMALGHIHAYKKAQLDARGTYCYSGCLEGRGFDECGEHGFVVIDVDEMNGKYKQEFVSFAQRVLYTIEVDITGCDTTAEIMDKVQEALKVTGCSKESLLKIVLKGMVDVEAEKNLTYLLAGIKSGYYFVKIYDETSLKVDIEDYLLDKSLKGEYVRLVMEDDSIPMEEKHVIIRYGLQAIAGEEVQ